MNNTISGNNHAVVLAGMCTALAVVLSFIGLYMPLLSTVVFLLIPLPIAYLGMKEGVKWSVIVTIGILILDSSFFGIVSAAFLCAIFGVLGVVMGVCYRLKVSATKTLIAASIVVLWALIAEALATMYLLGLPTLLFGGEGMAQLKDAMMQSLPSFYSGEALSEAEEKVSLLITAMEKSVPFTIVAVAVFYSWASMTLGSFVFKKMGIADIPHLPRFENWYLPKPVLYVYIAVLAGQFFLQDNETASYIIYNLGVACTFAFWIQGISTVWWLPHKYPFVRPLRIIIIALSVFVALIQMVVIFLGIADMAIDYRKRWTGK